MTHYYKRLIPGSRPVMFGLIRSDLVARYIPGHIGLSLRPGFGMYVRVGRAMLMLYRVVEGWPTALVKAPCL